MQSLGERQLLMGETPKTALAPQDRAASLLAGFLLHSITTGYTLKHDKEHL